MARAMKKAAKKASTSKTKKKMIASRSAAKKIKKVVKKAKKATKKVLAQPKGYYAVTPYLVVENASKAINFYKAGFGAKEVMCMNTPDGKVAHAELKIGDSKIMLGEECPQKGTKSPTSLGGTPMSIYLYVKNVDAVMQSAVAAGATVIREAQDMFYGDRSGGLQDPSGHQWYVATHIEDVSPANMKKRASELYGSGK